MDDNFGFFEHSEKLQSAFCSFIAGLELPADQVRDLLTDEDHVTEFFRFGRFLFEIIQSADLDDDDLARFNARSFTEAIKFRKGLIHHIKEHRVEDEITEEFLKMYRGEMKDDH